MNYWPLTKKSSSQWLEKLGFENWPWAFKMCASLAITLQPFADVISMANVHDYNVLGFQAAAVALIDCLPGRKCHPELINPGPHMRAGKIAGPKTLASFFTRGVLFPVERTHQNLKPDQFINPATSDSKFKIRENSTAKIRQTGMQEKSEWQRRCRLMDEPICEKPGEKRFKKFQNQCCSPSSRRSTCRASRRRNPLASTETSCRKHDPPLFLPASLYSFTQLLLLPPKHRKNTSLPLIFTPQNLIPYNFHRRPPSRTLLINHNKLPAHKLQEPRYFAPPNSQPLQETPPSVSWFTSPVAHPNTNSNLGSSLKNIIPRRKFSKLCTGILGARANSRHMEGARPHLQLSRSTLPSSL